MYIYIYILKIRVYLQILFDVNLNFIEQFDFLEIFCYFGGMDEAMRTRFMCSVDNEAVLKALFKIKDDELSISKAIQVAMNIEDAAKCAKEKVYGEKMSNVDKIR